MSPDTWIAIAGVVIAALALALPLVLQLRKDGRERDVQAEERVRKAVKDATEPLIADRDYYRSRCDQLEDELRRRDDRP